MALVRECHGRARLDEDLKVEEVIAELQRTFVPFFLIPDSGRATRCGARWRDLLGDHAITMDSPEDVCFVSAGAILVLEGRATDMAHLTRMLKDAGMPDARSGAVIRALTPLAEGTKGNGGPA